MKWRKKRLLSCSKSSMDKVGNFVNHSLAAPFRVVGKKWHNISLGGCWRPRVVLKVLSDPKDPLISQTVRAVVGETLRALVTLRQLW